MSTTESTSTCSQLEPSDQVWLLVRGTDLEELDLIARRIIGRRIAAATNERTEARGWIHALLEFAITKDNDPVAAMNEVLQELRRPQLRELIARGTS